MGFHVSRGRVVGTDWDPQERFIAHEAVYPMPCYTLFNTAVMFGNGSVAPCRGSYYAPDDMGRVAADGRPGASSFKAVWNNERFQQARRGVLCQCRHESSPKGVLWQYSIMARRFSVAR